MAHCKSRRIGNGDLQGKSRASAVLAFLAIPGLVGGAVLPHEWELAGFAETEARVFPEAPAGSDQFEHFDVSLALEPELFKRWGDPQLTFTLRPFLRLDLEDDQRTHFDLRELLVGKSADRWEVRAGVGKVFWGVAESQHLVDVINQTDFVENVDGEDKLGQPMLNVTWVTERAGAVNLFYLPYFRERSFPGLDGRLRSAPRVDVGGAEYESGLEEWHPDVSLRWSHAVGDFDVGVHYFRGTSRDPLFRPRIASDGEVALRPVYNLMHQGGLDAQWTREGWLLKFEGIVREGRGQRLQAFVGGFEHSFYGLMGSSTDLGLIAEYHYSSRRQPGSTLLNNDLFLGTRLAFNDTQDTSLLAGVFHDVRDQTTFGRVEFERRLGERYTLEIQGQWFARSDPGNLAAAFGRDSFVQVALRRYF